MTNTQPNAASTGLQKHRDSGQETSQATTGGSEGYRPKLVDLGLPDSGVIWEAEKPRKRVPAGSAPRLQQG